MRIVEPSFEIVYMPEYADILRVIEMAGRTCWQSEPKGKPEEFIKHLKKMGHDSVIEDMFAVIKLICDRGVSHEIVRHRIAGYSQSSTRYCNYAKEKFGGEIVFVRPFFFKAGTDENLVWAQTMSDCEDAYLRIISNGRTPQEARSVLPNSLKTEIVISANMREWRHIFKLRCGKASHPQMRQSMLPVLAEFNRRCPVLFEDIYEIHKEEISNAANP